MKLIILVCIIIYVHSTLFKKKQGIIKRLVMNRSTTNSQKVVQMRFIEVSSEKSESDMKTKSNEQSNSNQQFNKVLEQSQKSGNELESQIEQMNNQIYQLEHSEPIQSLYKRIDGIELKQKESTIKLQDQNQRILFQMNNTENTNIQLKGQMQEIVNENIDFRRDLLELKKQQEYMNQIIINYIQQQQMVQQTRISQIQQQPQMQQIEQKDMNQVNSSIQQNNQTDIQKRLMILDNKVKQKQEQSVEQPQLQQTTNNTMFLQNEQMQAITEISDYPGNQNVQSERYQMNNPKMDQMQAADLDDLDLEDIQQQIQIDK